MNGNLNVKTINDFGHGYLLSTVDHCPFLRESFLTKGTSNLLLVTYQYLFMTFIWWKGRPWITLLNNGQFFDVNQNLIARTLKNQFSPSSVCFFVSLHRTTKKFLAFIKAFVNAFVVSIKCASFNVDWLAKF